MSLLADMNLDDEQEVTEFIQKYGTLGGEALARRLEMTGPALAQRGNFISEYVFIRNVAFALRRNGYIAGAVFYESRCDKIYKYLPLSDRW